MASVCRGCCLMWTYMLRGWQSFATSKQTYCALQQQLVYNGPCELHSLLLVVTEFMVHLWFSSLIHCEILALMLLASNAPASEIPLRVWADDSMPDKDSLSTPTHTHIDTGKQYVTLIIANVIWRDAASFLFAFVSSVLFLQKWFLHVQYKFLHQYFFPNSWHFLLAKERKE